MAKLALVNAAVTQPIFASIPLSTSRVERLAEVSGLSPSIVEEQTAIVPLHAVEQFLFALQRSVGEPLFLYQSLDFDKGRGAHAVANIPMPSGLTGLEAMRGVARSISSQIVGARFLCVVSDDGRVWLLRTAATTDWTNNWPVQQYNLRAILDSVRLVFGYQISPVAVRLSVTIAPRDLPDDIRSCPIEFNPATMGLAFDLAEVVRAPSFPLVQSSEPQKSASAKADEVTVEVLTECLSNFISSTIADCSSERAARSFGMSERTYRRRLEDLGTTHSELISNARLSAATRLLKDRSLSITRIAGELGYSNPSHFTRFFARRVGISPAEYRRTLGK